MSYVLVAELVPFGIEKEKVMHVDKYVVNNIGTKWVKGKQKKNVVIGTIDGDSIDFKKLVRLLEDWHETVNGEYASRNVELVVNITEED